MSWIINFSKVINGCKDCPFCQIRHEFVDKHGLCYSCLAEEESCRGYSIGYPTKYRPCPIMKLKKFDYNKKFKICFPMGIGASPKITNWWINNNYIVVESTWHGRDKYTNLFNIDGTPVDALCSNWYPGEGSDYMFLENCDGEEE